MSYLVFTDDAIEIVAAPDQDQLVAQTTNHVLTESDTSSYVVFDHAGTIVTERDDGPGNFVVVADGDQIVVRDPVLDPAALVLGTGQGPKGDPGAVGGPGSPGDDGSDGAVGPAGPQGPAGIDSGDLGAVSAEFIQSSPATTWNITHSLGYSPAVTVVDSAGTRVEGEITYTSDSLVVVSFAGAFSGTAFLS